MSDQDRCRGSRARSHAQALEGCLGENENQCEGSDPLDPASAVGDEQPHEEAEQEERDEGCDNSMGVLIDHASGQMPDRNEPAERERPIGNRAYGIEVGNKRTEKDQDEGERCGCNREAVHCPPSLCKSDAG